jgi:hypothetical protein
VCSDGVYVAVPEPELRWTYVYRITPLGSTAELIVPGLANNGATVVCRPGTGAVVLTFSYEPYRATAHVVFADAMMVGPAVALPDGSYMSSADRGGVWLSHLVSPTTVDTAESLWFLDNTLGAQTTPVTLPVRTAGTASNGRTLWAVTQQHNDTWTVSELVANP